MISEFMDESHNIEGGIVYSQGKAVGLLIPSTLIGFDKDHIHISGRKGIVKLQNRTAADFWSALIESDSIMFGDETHIRRCQSLLTEPQYSRTFSYLATVASNCRDLLSRFDALRKSKVLVVGCGGIGSLTALNLAGAGVESMTLADDDTIEISNLNRQFFWTRDDVGKTKVSVLSHLLAERYPHIKLDVVTKKMQAADAISLADSYDALVVTADEPLGLGREISERSKVFVAYAGYFQGYAGYLVRKNYEKGVANIDSVQWLRNPYFIGPSFGPTNTELAGALSSACIHYLCRKHDLNVIDLTKIWRSDRLSEHRISEH
ncbi:ThiF family adenylyltransferase [Variovorax sp. KK3]|uniref:ThiF family adenylyltransferase n=1 Tax=Variovorax sp. KK3 TaxID=1855728 RepID=UPI0009FABE56|nr:ThiF family adenylyltransferase [Variovorax sp. KK3]